MEDSKSKRIQEYLGLSNRPVGVKVMGEGQRFDDTGYDTMGSRGTSCQYVREASRGKDFMVRQEHLNCPNAEVVLGFRETRLANIEPRIREKTVALRIGPVEDADVVALVLNPEQAMALSNLVEGIVVSFKRNRTVCGEGIAHVYNSHQSVLTFLCLGARTRGGFEENELLVSLPYEVFLNLPSKMSRFASLNRRVKDSLAQRLIGVH